MEEWGEEEEPFTLFHLPWDDILFTQLLPYLEWEDLFRLGVVSRAARICIQRYFKALKELHIRSHPFTLSRFKMVTEECGSVKSLILNGADWIRDEELSHLFVNNPWLSHVDLSGCASLKGHSLLTLAVNCKGVKSLLLGNCNWLSRGALETLMSHLTSITELDLSSCSALSSELIVTLTQRFSKLETLRLAHLESVSDATLLQIAKECTQLKVLDIQGCKGVTDIGIRSVGEYGRRLSSVYLHNCVGVTERSVGPLLRARGIWVDRPSFTGIQTYPAQILHLQV